MLPWHSLPLPTAIRIASEAYGVPQRAILRDLETVSRQQGGIGPMGIAPAWLPRLARAGFVPEKVRTIPQWNIAAGTWILARVLRAENAPQIAATWTEHPVAHLAEDLQVAAQASDLPATFLAAVVVQESGGDPDARSPKGAMGLMQLMPATARRLGVVDPWNPRQNLIGGAEYLADLLRQFGGNPVLALAAYNAGPKAVRRFGGVPPFAQTQAYVPAVLAHYRWLSDAGTHP